MGDFHRPTDPGEPFAIQRGRSGVARSRETGPPLFASEGMPRTLCLSPWLFLPFFVACAGSDDEPQTSSAAVEEEQAPLTCRQCQTKYRSCMKKAISCGATANCVGAWYDCSEPYTECARPVVHDVCTGRTQ
jgi:hypothetical protein